MLLRGFCKRILLPLLSLFSLVSPASGSSEDCTGNVLYLEACETAVRDDYCLHMWENCTEITVSGGLYLSFTDIDSLQPLHRLEKVTGDFILQQNQKLASLAGLENLTNVTGSFVVEKNHLLTDLSALSGLLSVGTVPSSGTNGGYSYLEIDTNNELTSLKGLENVQHVPLLYLWGNAKLADLSALSFSRAREIDIRDSLALTSVLFLSNVVQTAGIRLTGCPAVDDFPALPSLDQFSIERAVRITNVPLLYCSFLEEQFDQVDTAVASVLILDCQTLSPTTPTSVPTSQPTASPSSVSTSQPTASPSPQPTSEPTDDVLSPAVCADYAASLFVVMLASIILTLTF